MKKPKHCYTGAMDGEPIQMALILRQKTRRCKIEEDFVKVGPHSGVLIDEDGNTFVRVVRPVFVQVPKDRVDRDAKIAKDRLAQQPAHTDRVTVDCQFKELPHARPKNTRTPRG